MEEMRRKDREVTELEAVKEIIRQCDVLRLGLADGDYPYIVPMNFGWEEKEGRLRNGQGDCYPADRGRKAPSHAAFDRPVPARRTGLPAAGHGPHRHVAAGGGRLERQGE